MTDRTVVSRREMIGLAALASVPLPAPLAAQSPAGPRALPELNRFPRMMQEYFAARASAIEARSLKSKASLKTRADVENYIQQTRRRIRACFGPDPECTPLNARITGTLERDAYRIDKVIFESRPNFPVTANLYIPKKRRFPLPGVVGSCGHSENAKAAATYQSFAQGLARMGYVVLIFDPIGQGERLQYVDASFRPRIGAGPFEHLYAGNQQFLVAEFFGMWRAWDGIRALDYLLTRPEVDPKLIGVTGNSGGGTMTTWLCALDPRWAMAAPSCFVTTFRRNLQNELRSDTEQCPPRALALGLDQDDFLAMMAPKPLILIGGERDFFDARGQEEIYIRLKRIYRLLGAEQNIACYRGPGPHGFSQDKREAMYRWFHHVTGISNAQTEPPLTLEKDEVLYCAPKGQVAALNPRTVHSFTVQRSQELTARSRPLIGEALAKAVIATLRLPATRPAPDFNILRPRSDRKYPKPHAATYAIESEPGIRAIVYRLSNEPLLSQPPRGQKRAVLYVSHQSSDAELRQESLIRELLEAEPEAAFFTCDARGAGESRPGTCEEDSYLDPRGSDYFYAIHSIMLDYPYVGQRTYDLLCVLDWLHLYGHVEIHLAAKGWGAIPAAFAALLSSEVVQVTLKHALRSYQELAESELYRWPLSAIVPRILERFDLPDCYRALESKRLRLIEPLGANDIVS